MDLNLLVRVYGDVRQDGQVLWGTGYPVAPGRILTARHVLCRTRGGKIDPTRIELTWFRHPDCRRDEETIKTGISIEWDGEDQWDAVVLACPFPKDIVLPRATLQRSEPRARDLWHSEGFALVGKTEDGRRDPVKLDGRLMDFQPANTHLTMGVDYSNYREGGWKGISGAPVFSQRHFGPESQRIIGVIVTTVEYFRNDRLQAVPICRLIKEEGFREAVCLPTIEVDLKPYRDKIGALLIPQISAISDLENLLDFAGDGRKPDARARDLAEQLAAYDDLYEVLRILERAFERCQARGDQTAAEAILAVGLLLAPARYSPERLDRLRERFGLEGAQPIDATSVFVAEILIAGLGGRAADFDGSDPKKPMRGFPMPPEGGAAGRADSHIRDFMEHLLAAYGEDKDEIGSDPSRVAAVLGRRLIRESGDPELAQFVVFRPGDAADTLQESVLKDISDVLQDHFPMVAQLLLLRLDEEGLAVRAVEKEHLESLRRMLVAMMSAKPAKADREEP